jgi:tetratricopeptide (TPR) repeat protein
MYEIENNGIAPGNPWFYSLKNPERWKAKGDDYFLAGDFDNALKCYCQAIALRPNYHEAWKNKSNALQGLGRIEEAGQISTMLNEWKKTGKIRGK